jgi:hypothetical protein
MKLLVLGTPRSRSNVVTDSLAKFYNIPNLAEPYLNLMDDMNYVGRVEQLTNVLLKKQDFVCKLQSTNISINPLDAYTQFQFNVYDGIYITSRENIVDQIASLIVANTNNTWAYYLKNPTPIMFVQTEHMYLLGELETDIKKINILKNQLIKDNIVIETLYYETSEEWINNNLNNATTEFEKSNYNYKKIISNYNELDDVVSRYFEKFESL